MPDALQAPVQLFNFRPATKLQSSPSLPVNSAQQQRMKNLLEERKTWILMTPEEIFGAGNAQKTLGLSDPDTLDRQKGQTQMERLLFLERQNDLQNGPTNGVSNDRNSPIWNLNHNRDNVNPLASGLAQPVPAARGWGQLFDNQQNLSGAVTQSGNFSWPVFNQTAPPGASTTKLDLEQEEAMERFRQLLNPPPRLSEDSRPGSQYFSVPKPVGDSIVMQPDFVPNPAGASFIPLSSGVARPTGLTPLPNATAPSFAPVTAPVSRVQPPPWLLQGPQPFVMPQRAF